MERICENTVAIDNINELRNFVPVVRSGEWSDIGSREHMEDAHVCIGDLAKKFGCHYVDGEVVSFYGVSIKHPLFFHFSFSRLLYCNILICILIAMTLIPKKVEYISFLLSCY